MSQPLYRRPLPSHAIAFSSPAGRRVFAEALASEGLNGYFPLAEQFHTQSDPAFCGLGSLLVALHALAIDPERLWEGPARGSTGGSLGGREYACAHRCARHPAGHGVLRERPPRSVAHAPELHFHT